MPFVGHAASGPSRCTRSGSPPWASTSSTTWRWPPLAERCAAAGPLGVPVHHGAPAHRPGARGARSTRWPSCEPPTDDELRALLQRYARAADDRDVEALAALFHPEAEIDRGPGHPDPRRVAGHHAGARAFPTSMHVLGDPLIALGTGADEAALDTYAVVHQLGDPARDGADLTLGIRYLDDVVRHEGRWVIRRRQARTLWMR